MKEGQLFFTSMGEYSDYGVGAFFRAKKQFSWDKEYERWEHNRIGEDELEQYKRNYGSTSMNFYQYLIDKGFVVEEQVQEVYLGYSWDSWDAMDPKPAKDADDDVAG